MKAAKTQKHSKEIPYPPNKKTSKEKSYITPAKTNTPISQTSSECLKLTSQSYRMWKKKELKMKLGQLQQEISKASLPVCADLRNDFKSIIFKTDQRKVSPFMRLFWEE